MNETKVAVSMAEMARMVGLSRTRFYQLVGKTFPFPIYAVATRRPFYTEELQLVCLEVRRRNCGIDGRPVLFYCRGAKPTTSKKTKPVQGDQHADLLEGLRELGLATVTTQQVSEAVRSLYPNGVAAEPEGAVLRAVFLRIKRQVSAGNVGR
jgi:hypothetical protein